MADVRARLFVLAGPDLARSFDLGERAVLGRSEECDVVLQDRSISRKHAVLVLQDGQWFVQDLGSTNGVTKAGKRVERTALADGEEFRLGDLPLRLRLVGAEEVRDEALEFASPVAVAAQAAKIEPRRVPEVKGSLAPPAEEGEVEIEIEGADEQGPRESSGPRAPLDVTAFRAPRAARRSGFFSGDIEQMPFWMRSVVVLLLLALGAGLCFGAFWAVQTLRSGL